MKGTDIVQTWTRNKKPSIGQIKIAANFYSLNIWLPLMTSDLSTLVDGGKETTMQWPKQN
jgi:hypothetical protein